MGFSCGLVGLPNAGKTTIFNALTGASAQIASYPFTTIEPNISVVPVPDARLKRLSEIYSQQNAIHATIKFVDIAGLVKGASRGEGLGNQFLAHIRDVDAIGLVIRCFDDPDVSHVLGRVEPQRELEIVTLELLLKDMEILDNRLKKVLSSFRAGEKKNIEEAQLLEELKRHLSEERPARVLKKSQKMQALTHELRLLTDKPALYIANVDEEELERRRHSHRLKESATGDGAAFILVPGRLERELMEMEESERREMMKAYGIEEMGIFSLIREGYRILSLITFYTAVGKELRAWSILRGTRAHEAAGKIHSDMERGFIKAEVINFSEIDRIGSEHKAREMGLLRTEGRDYEVQDGDVVRFLFRA